MISEPFDTAFVKNQISNILNFMTTSLDDTSLEIHGAILDGKGDLIDAVGPNPIHYGALEAVTKSVKKYITPKVGETVITNDPFGGNTRLCDLVLLHPCYSRTQTGEIRFYLVLQISILQLLNQNLEQLATSIEGEGFRIPPTHLEQGLTINQEIIKYLSQSGATEEFLTKCLSQARMRLISASKKMVGLEQKMGREKIQKSLDGLNKYSENAMRRALREIPDGDYTASDTIDGDGFDKNPLKIQCKISVRGENSLVSFLGSAKQTKGPFNCTSVMTLGACFWVFRSLVRENIPVNAGAFRAFAVEAPEGTIVNAKYPSPLLGGYYETTQRICDSLYLLLNKVMPNEIPSQNGGSTSLCIIKSDDKIFAEPLSSGGGATKALAGADCVFASLRNYPSQSIEVIEMNYPLSVTHSSIRDASGGDGKFPGGRGYTRGYKFLSDASVMILADRRLSKARGFFGGVSGLNGEILVIQSAEKRKIVTEKAIFKVSAGSTLFISTPGGGGWGKKEVEKESEASQ